MDIRAAPKSTAFFFPNKSNVGPGLGSNWNTAKKTGVLVFDFNSLFAKHGV